MPGSRFSASRIARVSWRPLNLLARHSGYRANTRDDPPRLAILCSPPDIAHLNYQWRDHWRQDIKPRAPLDLVEVRRQLTVMRSRHSNDRRVTRLINKTLVKLAHLHEPADRAQETRLRELIAKTVHMVETITSRGPS
jgi:hypothetical protein